MLKRLVFAACVAAAAIASDGALAQDTWQVQKASGEVWVISGAAQSVALSFNTTVNPGDRIRTGQNGRVLLARGSQTILIAPNSTIGLPAQTGAGLATTILQESGSILLEVEQKAQKHFEVETPYLVAVVKGTQFRVTADGTGSQVDVISGQVEVADLKSGQYALVFPGQVAKVSIDGPGGLSLSGTGGTDAIKEGTPRASRVPAAAPPELLPRPGNKSAQSPTIKTTLGDVKLDFQKVTKGLARSAATARAATDRNADTKSAGDGASNSGNGGGNSGNGGGNGIGNAFGLGGGNGGSPGSGGGNGLALGHVIDGLGNGVGAGLGNAFGKGACKGKGSSC
jgi:hypothetical protein